MGVSSDNALAYTYRQQFGVLPDEVCQDGTAFGSWFLTLVGRWINNAKLTTRANLWSEERTTAAFANVATTTRTLIDELAPVPVPDGYTTARIWIRARQRQTVATAPSITFYSDHRSPTLVDGTTGVSDHAHASTITVASTDWAWYTATLTLARDLHGQTVLSVWGKAEVGGDALNQAEWSHVDILVCAPDESGDVVVETPAVVTVLD